MTSGEEHELQMAICYLRVRMTRHTPRELTKEYARAINEKMQIVDPVATIAPELVSDDHCNTLRKAELPTRPQSFRSSA